MREIVGIEGALKLENARLVVSSAATLGLTRSVAVVRCVETEVDSRQ